MKITTELSQADDKPDDTGPISDNPMRKDHNPNRVHSVPAGREAMTALHCEGIYANPLPLHLTVLDLNIPLHLTPLVILITSKARDDIASSYQPCANSHAINARSILAEVPNVLPREEL
jgi:hypothetical protein